jgi:hypothetical protein
VKRAASVAALLFFGGALGAQKVVVRDAGPDAAGQRLVQLLANPATRVIVADTVEIARDSTIRSGLVIVGRRATIAGEVRGNVIVAGGDLFLSPGVRIGGDAIAIGGGVYGTLLGVVTGTQESYRDFTYDVERSGDTVYLRYRPTYVERIGGPLSLPGVFGLRIPTYDRTNGISLGIGPAFETKGLRANAVAVYRSNLGRVDPQLSVTAPLTRRTSADLFAGRDTRSNDDWINSRLANSVNVFINGRDERDWYRATVIRAHLSSFLTPLGATAIGVQMEKASEVRPLPGSGGGPWSITGRHSVEGMLRPNIPFVGTTTHSILLDQTLTWAGTDYQASLTASDEMAVSTNGFQQFTGNGKVSFATFGLQRYRGELHTSIGDGPEQRYGCLGGSGTLPVEETFSMCGNHVLYIDNRYEIPISMIVLPLVGSPTLTLRYAVGGAAVGALPDLAQNIGVRLSVPFLRVQLMYDPSARKTKFSAGLSLSR